VRRFNLRSLSFGPDDEAWADIPVEVDPFIVGGEAYEVKGGTARLELTVGRVGARYTLVARTGATLVGPCQRCLEPAHVSVEAEGRETALRGDSEGVEEGEDPYVTGWQLDAERWVRDLIGAALPTQLLCREDCRGLCPICGADLNADEDHEHEEG